jgi:hypothetical protein
VATHLSNDYGSWLGACSEQFGTDDQAFARFEWWVREGAGIPGSGDFTGMMLSSPGHFNAVALTATSLIDFDCFGPSGEPVSWQIRVTAYGLPAIVSVTADENPTRGASLSAGALTVSSGGFNWFASDEVSKAALLGFIAELGKRVFGGGTDG